MSRIQATGILKRYYGELLLSLTQGWNAQAFWFDWRLDINTAADELATRIQEWFGDHEPVHLSGPLHGWPGGPGFHQEIPGALEIHVGLQDDGRRGGRLVMLGTPNHGSLCHPAATSGPE